MTTPSDWKAPHSHRLSRGFAIGILLVVCALAGVVLITIDRIKLYDQAEAERSLARFGDVLRTQLTALDHLTSGLAATTRTLPRDQSAPFADTLTETLTPTLLGRLDVDMAALLDRDGRPRLLAAPAMGQGRGAAEALEGVLASLAGDPSTGFLWAGNHLTEVGMATTADGDTLALLRILSPSRLDAHVASLHIAPVEIHPLPAPIPRPHPAEGLLLHDPFGHSIAVAILEPESSLPPLLQQLTPPILACVALFGLGGFLIRHRHGSFVDALNTSAQDLAQSEARFRGFAEAASDWFWEAGPDLRYTYVSPRLREVTGNHPEAVLGTSLRDLCQRICTEDSERSCRHCIATGQAFRDLDLPVQSPTGKILHFRMNGVPVTAEDGTPLGYRGTGREVTTEVTASEEREALRSMLFDAVESISEGFVLFDPAGRLVVANARYREAYPQLAEHLTPGVTFEQVLRVAAQQLGLPGGEDEVQGWVDKRLQRHLTGGYTDSRLSNGRWYRISEHATTSGGVVKVLMDITALKNHEARLAEQSALLKATFGAIDQGIAVFDSHGRMRTWNPRLPFLMDYPAGLCAEGQSFAAFAANDENRHVITTPLTGGDPAVSGDDAALQDAEKLLPSGLTMECRFNPLPDAGFVMTVTDVSDAKRQQQVLANLASTVSVTSGLDMFATLARGLAAALDMDEAFVAEFTDGTDSINPLAIVRDGDTLPPEGHPVAGSAVSTLLSNGVCMINSQAALRYPRDPRITDLKAESYLGQVLSGTDGRPLGMIAVLSRRPLANIGRARELLPVFAARAASELERLHVSMALKEGEALLRTFVEYTPAAVAMVDRSMRYLRISRRWLVDFGLGDQDIIGANHYDVIPETPEEWKQEHARVLTGAVVERSEDRLERNGKTVWLRRLDHPWFRADGSVGGIMMFAEVITERKQAELALQQSQKMDAVGQLAGGIAHEFNNMLTSIGGFARMAGRDPANQDRVRMCLGEITKSSDRAAGLTSQLLNFSRRTSEDDVGIVSIAETLEDLERFLRPVLGENVQLVLDPAEEDLSVFASQQRLHQAVVNLCINARDAMPSGGEVRVGATRGRLPDSLRRLHPHLAVGDYACISVADTGTGIAEDVLPRIFEPFFTTKEQGKGTGLGLPMVYSMAEQAGGAVEVASQLGEGTRFTMYLPLSDAAGQRVEAAPSATFNAGSATILLAEDEAAVRRFLALALRDQGYSVIEAANGREALAEFLEDPEAIDLVITDMVMPEMGGPELVEQALRHRADLKVLLISGYSSHQQWTNKGDHPWRRLLAKPISPDVLITTVEDLLS